MKLIPLSRGLFAEVDDEDYDFLMQWKWFAHKGTTGGFYAVRNEPTGNGKQRSVKMHRVIMKLTDPKIFVDHRDNNGLNNQRANLRLATAMDNRRNVLPKINAGTSKFKGVSWCSKGNNWVAQISNGDKKISLGHFKKEIHAAVAYNEGAIKYHGEFANLNIIPQELLPEAIEREKPRKSVSQYRGVVWYGLTNRWRAQISFKGKSKGLGYFIFEIDAALAYNKAALIYHKELANLNIIDDPGLFQRLQSY